MKTPFLLAAAVLFATSTIQAQTPAVAVESKPVSVGGITGVVRGPDKVSVAGATITITRADGSGLWTTISDANGIYSVSNLAPGEYRVTSQADGFPDASIASLQIVAGKATRIDVAMTAVDAKASPAPSPAPAPLSASTNAAGQNTFDRLIRRQPVMSRNPALTNPPVAEPVSTASLGAPPAGAFDKPAAATPDLPFPANPAPQEQAQAGAAPAPPATPEVDNVTPFADYDWTWLNGNPRNHDVAFDSKFFTPEIRADLTYTYDFNHPVDNSMGGSSELFRANEIQLEQLGLGGDFHWDNVRARFMTQFGGYSTATIRNDGSYSKGQWDLADADRYLAEAYGGYHINWMHGMNIDAGIFMSYIGLFSYYNYDNWAYQPSYVSSNTPWFFQGIRIQIFPTHHLKLEPWIINGWQSYASANSRKGLGGQIKWTPKPWFNLVSNNYGLGHDDLYAPQRNRLHTDNSFEFKFYENQTKFISKNALTFTGDLGCEWGDGVSCHNSKNGNPKQSFIGYMIYERTWFKHDTYAITFGGGQINNPGRYLVLIPPINGESAASAAINSPYFTFNPGDPFKAWDTSVTFDYMPRQWITFRFEGDYRHANVPYWSGAGGVTPPAFLGSATGTNNGYPTQYVCNDGTPAGMTLAPGACSGNGGVWYPDLKKNEILLDIDLMVKF
ncbi:MAG TPA: TonB-dependent receptor [Bryobacteraceae bacterium]|nr:TonB-dependent receptor [Bryobacteraceae bacterium]